MNFNDMVNEVERLSHKIDEGIKLLYDSGMLLAKAEHECSKAIAKAWIDAPKGTVPFREAWVDAEVADLMYEKDMAEASKMSSLEAVRSRRTQLSAVQSLLAAYRAEAEMARYGVETH